MFVGEVKVGNLHVKQFLIAKFQRVDVQFLGSALSAVEVGLDHLLIRLPPLLEDKKALVAFVPSAS